MRQPCPERDAGGVPPAGGLRLPHCPTCGYDLDGARERYACSECGATWPEEAFAVYGRLAHDSAQSIGYLVTAVGIIGFALYRLVFIPDHPAIIAVLLAVGAYAVYEWSRRFALRATMAGPYQFLFTPDGVGYRVGWGAVQLEPWSAFSRFRLRPMYGAWRFELRRQTFCRVEIGEPIIGLTDLPRAEAHAFRCCVEQRVRAGSVDRVPRRG